MAIKGNEHLPRSQTKVQAIQSQTESSSFLRSQSAEIGSIHLQQDSVEQIVQISSSSKSQAMPHALMDGEIEVTKVSSEPNVQASNQASLEASSDFALDSSIYPRIASSCGSHTLKLTEEEIQSFETSEQTAFTAFTLEQDQHVRKDEFNGASNQDILKSKQRPSTHLHTHNALDANHSHIPHNSDAKSKPLKLSKPDLNYAQQPSTLQVKLPQIDHKLTIESSVKVETKDSSALTSVFSAANAVANTADTAANASAHTAAHTPEHHAYGMGKNSVEAPRANSDLRINADLRAELGADGAQMAHGVQGAANKANGDIETHGGYSVLNEANTNASHATHDAPASYADQSSRDFSDVHGTHGTHVSHDPKSALDNSSQEIFHEVSQVGGNFESMYESMESVHSEQDGLFGQFNSASAVKASSSDLSFAGEHLNVFAQPDSKTSGKDAGIQDDSDGSLEHSLECTTESNSQDITKSSLKDWTKDSKVRGNDASKTGNGVNGLASAIPTTGLMATSASKVATASTVATTAKATTSTAAISATSATGKSLEHGDLRHAEDTNSAMSAKPDQSFESSGSEHVASKETNLQVSVSSKVDESLLKDKAKAQTTTKGQDSAKAKSKVRSQDKSHAKTEADTKRSTHSKSQDLVGKAEQGALIDRVESVEKGKVLKQGEQEALNNISASSLSSRSSTSSISSGLSESSGLSDASYLSVASDVSVVTAGNVGKGSKSGKKRSTAKAAKNTKGAKNSKKNNEASLAVKGSKDHAAAVTTQSSSNFGSANTESGNFDSTNATFNASAMSDSAASSNAASTRVTSTSNQQKAGLGAGADFDTQDSAKLSSKAHSSNSSAQSTNVIKKTTSTKATSKSLTLEPLVQDNVSHAVELGGGLFADVASAQTSNALEHNAQANNTQATNEQALNALGSNAQGSGYVPAFHNDVAAENASLQVQSTKVQSAAQVSTTQISANTQMQESHAVQSQYGAYSATDMTDVKEVTNMTARSNESNRSNHANTQTMSPLLSQGQSGDVTGASKQDSNVTMPHAVQGNLSMPYTPEELLSGCVSASHAAWQTRGNVNKGSSWPAFGWEQTRSPQRVTYMDVEPRYLELLSTKYPNRIAAFSEIINLQAILNLPKGTEHFVSDIHGEYEAFRHILNNCSGVIKEKVDLLFTELNAEQKADLCTLIYYPQEVLKSLESKGLLTAGWYREVLNQLIRLCKYLSSKYTRSKVRKAINRDYAYIIDELLHAQEGESNSRALYHSKIIDTILHIHAAHHFVTSLCALSKRLAVDHLHVVGDIFDRGAHPDQVMALLMDYHSLDIQWGNHDILWMGAACGSEACMATVLRNNINYFNCNLLESAYGISLRKLNDFAQRTYRTPVKERSIKAAGNAASAGSVAHGGNAGNAGNVGNAGEHAGSKLDVSAKTLAQVNTDSNLGLVGGSSGAGVSADSQLSTGVERTSGGLTCGSTCGSSIGGSSSFGGTSGIAGVSGNAGSTGMAGTTGMGADSGLYQNEQSTQDGSLNGASATEQSSGLSSFSNKSEETISFEDQIQFVHWILGYSEHKLHGLTNHQLSLVYQYARQQARQRITEQRKEADLNELCVSTRKSDDLDPKHATAQALLEAEDARLKTSQSEVAEAVESSEATEGNAAESSLDKSGKKKKIKLKVLVRQLEQECAQPQRNCSFDLNLDASDVSAADSSQIRKDRMVKAITVIALKLQGQLIMRNPEFNMDDRLLLNKMDLKNGTVTIDGKTYELNTVDLPTIDPEHPFELSPEEAEVMESLKYSFMHSRELQREVGFLFSHGSIYKRFNGNLLYHGCIPMTEDGQFKQINCHGRKLSGKAFLDYCESVARRAYDKHDEQSLDFMYFLWCGINSPLSGRIMKPFERYFIDDKESHVEPRDPYYSFYYQEATCRKVLSEFNLDPDTGHIINGHTPIKVKQGESPIRGNGKLFVIDGGLCSAYHETTGIAGYTLIFSSHGMTLQAHRPFVSTEEAIAKKRDIVSVSHEVEHYTHRLQVADADNGIKLQRAIFELEALLDAYRQGILPESQK